MCEVRNLTIRFKIISLHAASALRSCMRRDAAASSSSRVDHSRYSSSSDTEQAKLRTFAASGPVPGTCQKGFQRALARAEWCFSNLLVSTSLVSGCRICTNQKADILVFDSGHVGSPSSSSAGSRLQGWPCFVSASVIACRTGKRANS